MRIAKKERAAHENEIETSHPFDRKLFFCCVFLQEFWLRVRRQNQGPVTDVEKDSNG